MKKALRFVSLLLAFLILLTAGACAEGILPLLQTPKPQEVNAISLHSATGAEYDSFERGEDGGYKYLYSDISYECYLEFSKKLAAEGYSLVSAETLEDGTSRAVVSNGEVTLTMDYKLDAQTAVVFYPPYVYARDAALYDDYIEIKDGDKIVLCDQVTATVKGWSNEEYYYLYSSSSTKRSGTNIVVLYLMLDYYRPERMHAADFFRHRVLHYGEKTISKDVPAGLVRLMDRMVYNDSTSSAYVEGQTQKDFAIVIRLTDDDQMQHLENVAVTFSDYYNAKRYVYWLKPAQAIPDELVGTWKGVGKPKNGGTSIDLTVQVAADGSGEYTFVQGSYKESYPFTVSHTDNTFAVDIPATSQLGKVEGTYALEDGKLVLDITTTFASGGTYSYTAECAREAE